METKPDFEGREQTEAARDGSVAISSAHIQTESSESTHKQSIEDKSIVNERTNSDSSHTGSKENQPALVANLDVAPAFEDNQKANVAQRQSTENETAELEAHSTTDQISGSDVSMSTNLPLIPQSLPSLADDDTEHDSLVATPQDTTADIATLFPSLPDVPQSFKSVDAEASPAKAVSVHPSVRRLHILRGLETARAEGASYRDYTPTPALEDQHVDDDIVEMYDRWCTIGKSPDHNHYSGIDGNKEYMRMVRLYVFADKIRDVELKNETVTDIMDRFVRIRMASQPKDYYTRRKVAHHPFGSVLLYLYQNTSKDDGLRRLISSFYAWYGEEDWLDWSSEEELAKDFLYDVARMSYTNKPYSEDDRRGKAEYCHEMDGGDDGDEGSPKKKRKCCGGRDNCNVIYYCDRTAHKKQSCSNACMRVFVTLLQLRDVKSIDRLHSRYILAIAHPLKSHY